MPADAVVHRLCDVVAKNGCLLLSIPVRGDGTIDEEERKIVEGIASWTQRYGEAMVPMDEALSRAVIDLSGRFYLVYEVKTRRQQIGNFSVELAEHFWRSFAETAKFNLHIDCLRGRNTHHILEATFKATARALRQAVERDARITGVLSTKGSL